MTTDILELSAVGESRDVILKLQDGSEIKLTLIEMDWTAHEAFIAAQKRRLEFTSSGEAVMKHIEGSRMDLLTRCILDSDQKLVTQEKFKAWKLPNRTIAALHEAAAKMNRARMDADTLVNTFADGLADLAKAGQLTEEHRDKITKAMETAAEGE